MCRELFGPKQRVRFRPSFFPFTEPSAEVDTTCPKCKAAAKRATCAAARAGSNSAAPAWCIPTCCAKSATIRTLFGLGVRFRRRAAGPGALRDRRHPPFRRTANRIFSRSCRRETDLHARSDKLAARIRRLPDDAQSDRRTSCNARVSGRRDRTPAGDLPASSPARSSASRNIPTPTGCRSRRSTSAASAAHDRDRGDQRCRRTESSRSPPSARACPQLTIEPPQDARRRIAKA